MAARTAGCAGRSSSNNPSHPSAPRGSGSYCPGPSVCPDHEEPQQMDTLTLLRPLSRRRALRLLGGATAVTAAGVGLARTAPGLDSAVDAVSSTNASDPQT